MDKSRINFKNYEIVNSGAKFYKGKDCEEGFYHVCDEYAPGGTRLLEFMPEIYRHDIRDFIELLKAFGLFVSCLVIGYGGLFLFFY